MWSYLGVAYCDPMTFLSDAHASNEDPARPMPVSWEQYESWLTVAWTRLLDSDPTERELQDFLERNPCLLPGGGGGYRGGTHGPYGVVFAESEIHGSTGSFRPDFMWITGNSAKVHPVMIEIEAPGRRYFTKAGDPTAHFSHAHRQVLDWKMWWTDPVNQQWFRRAFLDPIWDFKSRKIEPRYILIYGRSRETANDARSNLRRAELSQNDLEVMSFDRLQPSRDLQGIACVQRTSATARLRAVPSTFTTGPSTMRYGKWLELPDLEVFYSTPLWSAERARYVYDRFLHWQGIGKRGEDRGPVQPGDLE